jgi:hypothetical protein
MEKVGYKDILKEIKPAISVLRLLGAVEMRNVIKCRF